MKIRSMNDRVFVTLSSVRPCPNDCGYLLGEVAACPKRDLIDILIGVHGIKVGDTVIFGRLCGSRIDLEDEAYYIIHSKDITGVVIESKEQEAQ